MPLIPDLDAPGTVRPWWLVPAAAGQSSTVRLSLAHLAAVSRGAIALSFAPYVADVASTSDADPGAGKLRWNHATQASATVLFVDDSDANAGSNAALWATINVGAHLHMYNPDDLDVWQEWAVTAVADVSGYVKFTVTWVAGNGTFAASAPIVLTIQQPDASSSGSSVIDVQTPSNASGTVTLDFASKSRYVGSITLGANVGTLAFSNLPGAGKYAEYELHIKQDATGSRTFAIPASHKALGGSDVNIALAANAVTVLTASTVDNGTTWRYAMQESA